VVRTFQREGVGWFLVCFVSISFVSIPVMKRGSSSVHHPLVVFVRRDEERRKS